MQVRIPLGLRKDKFSVIDMVDYNKVKKYNWYAKHQYGDKYYARTKLPLTGKFIYMHRLIMDIGPNQICDHIDNDGLNNVRENIRICSYADNNRNKSINKNNKSGYKGIYWSPRHEKYRASIGLNKKNKHLGYFKCPLDAANAYDRAAKKYFKQFAKTNTRNGDINMKNMNDLAKALSKKEGLKKQVDIAQLKEVLRALAKIFAEEHRKGTDEAWTCFRDYALTFVDKKCKKN